MRWPFFFHHNAANTVSVVVNIIVFGGFMHVIYGDGVHNDTAAFEAFADHQTVWHAREQREIRADGKALALPSGEYRMNATLSCG